MAATAFLLVWLLAVLLPFLHRIEWTMHGLSVFFGEINVLYLAKSISVGALIVIGLNFLHHWLYSRILGQKNYVRIRKRIDLLNARLDAMVTQEKGLSIAPEAKSSWGLK
ncbi:MAG: hypothetical protein IPH31_16105 [Lewinellaceae bacterium]|nr:hypothetical protein [Lewinellaceae bacterium]